MMKAKTNGRSPNKSDDRLLGNLKRNSIKDLYQHDRAMNSSLRNTKSPEKLTGSTLSAQSEKQLIHFSESNDRAALALMIGA